MGSKDDGGPTFIGFMIVGTIILFSLLGNTVEERDATNYRVSRINTWNGFISAYDSSDRYQISNTNAVLDSPSSGLTLTPSTSAVKVVGSQENVPQGVTATVLQTFEFPILSNDTDRAIVINMTINSTHFSQLRFTRGARGIRPCATCDYSAYLSTYTRIIKFDIASSTWLLDDSGINYQGQGLPSALASEGEAFRQHFGGYNSTTPQSTITLQLASFNNPQVRLSSLTQISDNFGETEQEQKDRLVGKVIGYAIGGSVCLIVAVLAIVVVFKNKE